MRKLILFFIIAFATIGLTLPIHVSATELSTDSTLKRYTVADYIKYLDNYSEVDALNSGVSPEYVSEAVKESKTVLENFKQMPEETQQKFVESFTKFETGETVVESEGDDQDGDMFPMADKSISYTNSVKFFGAPVTTYKVSVNYKVTKGKVSKINSSKAYVVRNWNPVVRTDLNTNGKSHWIASDNKAVVEGSFFYRIGPLKDFGVQVGNVHLKAVGDKNGKRTYAKMKLD
ncbi:hypothetical protein ACG2K5_18140 [Bacillus subtilis]|uniref:hypothetical protein n=1 Tax=Bacillus subtilis TaxID=1423 RepID=UPI00376FD2AE